jgi:Bacterial EndoU nuclease
MKKIFIYTTLLLLFLLPVSMMGQCWLEQLATDLSTGSPAFKAYVKSNEGAFEAYEKLYLAKRSVLCKDAAALEAYSKASRNAKLKELGFTDEALASINSGADAQYAELLNNLDNLGNLAKSNNIAIEDIAGAVEILKGTNATTRQALHTRIKEIIADASGYSGKTVKLVGNAFKGITTDIGLALRNRITHIRKIIFEAKSNGTYKFSGCHSKSAIDELGVNARVEVTTPANAEGVYEAKVFAKDPTGIERMKSGNEGKSTFFPDSWNEAKILDETEFAVRNNRGLIDPTDATKGYWGYGKDGKTKIGFYYRDADGYIGSFFPILP